MYARKLNKFLNQLPNWASKSAHMHKHGAVLVRGGNPIAWSFNTTNGIKTYHAELNVVKKYLINCGLTDRIMQYYLLWASVPKGRLKGLQGT